MRFVTLLLPLLALLSLDARADVGDTYYVSAAVTTCGTGGSVSNPILSLQQPTGGRFEIFLNITVTCCGISESLVRRYRYTNGTYSDCLNIVPVTSDYYDNSYSWLDSYGARIGTTWTGYYPNQLNYLYISTSNGKRFESSDVGGTWLQTQ